MGNPLFQQIGGGMPGGMGGPFKNMQKLAQQFQQFQRTFTGNSTQQLQNLMSSGRVPQQMYNQAVQMAQQMQKMMGR